ncbi:MAG: hypothetical protein OEY79_04655 [Anaplasmataceae bacterium]|nr:hypothetical protein [Anaplasmataceae bacterium]
MTTKSERKNNKSDSRLVRYNIFLLKIKTPLVILIKKLVQPITNKIKERKLKKICISFSYHDFSLGILKNDEAKKYFYLKDNQNKKVINQSLPIYIRNVYLEIIELHSSEGIKFCDALQKIDINLLENIISFYNNYKNTILNNKKDEIFYKLMKEILAVAKKFSN